MISHTACAAYVEGNGPIQYELMAKYCNLWRNYDDIQDDWGSVSGIIDYWGTANGPDYKNFVHVARPGA
jgi:alpha-N-acetylgalactosaminidase